MNTKEDNFWQNLLVQSAPAFAADVEPPYGFTTRVLARLSEDKKQQVVMERIGFRAIFASLAFVVVAAVLTAGVQFHDRDDLDPGVKSIALAENLQVS